MAQAVRGWEEGQMREAEGEETTDDRFLAWAPG